MKQGDHIGFYKHGNLPHFDAHGTVQFVTFVLADAAPSERRPRMLDGRKPTGDSFFLQMDSELDRNTGSCILARRSIGRIVAEEIQNCELISCQQPAWVVMPNHVHMLFRQDRDCRLGEIMLAIKVQASKRINHMLGRSGKLWQKSYFDRAMRSPQHVRSTIEYIHNNPVAARLVNDPKDWALSSIHSFDQASEQELCSFKQGPL